MASWLFFVFVDVASAVLTLLITAFFARLWRRSREPLDLLFTIGFLLAAIGFLSVAVSFLNPFGTFRLVVGLRVSGQTAAALVLLFAYLSVRVHGAARLWIALGWTAATGAVILALLFAAVPPFFAVPNTGTMLAAAHVVMAAAFTACAVMSGRGFARRRTLDRTLVPAAFLSMAVGNYTWLIFDVFEIDGLVSLAYMWRLLALVLFLLAVLLPARSPEEKPRAAA